MAVFDTHQKCAHCRKKGTGLDPCVLGQGDCPACSLLTPEQVQQLSVPAYKTRKAKKKGEWDESEKGDKLVNVSTVTVIGLSDTDNVVTVGVSQIKTVNKPPDQSSNSEFGEFKDQLSFRFTRLETALASVQFLPLLVKHLFSLQSKLVFLNPIPVWQALLLHFSCNLHPFPMLLHWLAKGIQAQTLMLCLVQPFRLTKDLDQWDLSLLPVPIFQGGQSGHYLLWLLW